MPFVKGKSGNPRGKPKGAKDRRTELRKLFDPHKEKLIRKAVSLALRGDTTALRICVDRLVAPLRPKDAPIRMGPLTGTLAQQGQRVLNALSSGELSPDEASSVMQTLATQARITEVDDLERRVAALEEKQKQQEKPHHVKH